MQRKEIKSIIESILFSMGESVEGQRLADVLEIGKRELKNIMSEMISEYEKEKRGIRIIEINDSYQMCTSQDAYDYLIKLVKIPKNYKLTDIQLETLSIIAYKQPVTKLEIEKIRGVQSDHAVNRLVEAGLVEEIGRLDQPGRPILFGTTEEFLRRFGLKNTEDLPDVNIEKVEAFKLEAEQELGYVADNNEAAPGESASTEESEEMIRSQKEIAQGTEEMIIIRDDNEGDPAESAMGSGDLN